MSQAAIHETDVQRHMAETDRAFGQNWVCVGHVAMLARTGDYFAIDLIGNLLVAVRSRDGIRVLSRVCLHRWASLVEGAGNIRRFTCPFHAWSYALDGRLIGAAFMEKAEDFDRAKCRLPEIRTEIDEESGLIFVNLSPASSAGTKLPASLAKMRLGASLAKGAFQEEEAPLGWPEALAAAKAASPLSLALPPNLIISGEAPDFILQIFFPNGPRATLVRTISLAPSKLSNDHAEGAGAADA